MDRLDDGLDLADAIEMLRAEVLAAQLKSADAKVQFPIEKFTIELKVGLTRKRDGKAGFKVPLVGAELGVSAGLDQTTTQTVTIVLGPPVDPQGRPIKVSQAADERKE
jgi:Trypsin-co-occurring domain 2